MSEYVRVRDTSGHEITIRADLPEGHPRGLQDGMTVLDKPATTRTGDPLPPKHRTALGTPLPGSAVDVKRTRKGATPKPVTAADPAPDNNDGHPADSETEI